LNERTGKSGFSALIYAAGCATDRSVKCAKLLLKAKARVDLSTRPSYNDGLAKAPSRFTALDFARKAGNKKMIALLLQSTEAQTMEAANVKAKKKNDNNGAAATAAHQGPCVVCESRARHRCSGCGASYWQVCRTIPNS